MKGKGRRAISFAVFLCLVLSYVCLDGWKAEDLVRTSRIQTGSLQIQTESLGSLQEAACTAEMLGTVQTLFLCRQVLSSSELRKKPELLSWNFIPMAAGRLPIRAFSPETLLLCEADSDSAEILHFIHDKDGKKKI